MIKALYITYDGLLDPLGQSQILPYFEPLTSKSINWSVLSFEKKNPTRDKKSQATVQQLSRANAKWFSLNYHRHPRFLSKIYDLIMGIFVILKQKESYDLILARSYIAAIIGLILKKIYHCKFIFDMRGLWPEEKVDGNGWKKNGFFFKIAKLLERKFITNADIIVVLTEKAKLELLKKYNILSPIKIIPTCVDMKKFSNHSKKDTQYNYLFCYSGSVGTWYCLDEMVNFIKFLRSNHMNANLLLLLNADVSGNTYRHPFSHLDFIKVETCPYSEVPLYLQKAQFGLYFIRPTYSKLASCPTKLGEFLSMGIPVITNKGIGDCDDWFKKNSLGVLVDDFTQASFAKTHLALKNIMNDNKIRERCIKFALENLSLQSGIFKYRSIIQDLFHTVNIYNG